MWHFKYGLIFIKTYDRMTFENVTLYFLPTADKATS